MKSHRRQRFFNESHYSARLHPVPRAVLTRRDEALIPTQLILQRETRHACTRKRYKNKNKSKRKQENTVVVQGAVQHDITLPKTMTILPNTTKPTENAM